jgi:hypothetical protein
MVLAEHVGKTEVDELDLVFLDLVEHLLGGHAKTSAGVDVQYGTRQSKGHARREKAVGTGHCAHGPATS